MLGLAFDDGIDHLGDRLAGCFLCAFLVDHKLLDVLKDDLVILKLVDRMDVVVISCLVGGVVFAKAVKLDINAKCLAE